jgi:hypothetical protein
MPLVEFLTITAEVTFRVATTDGIGGASRRVEEKLSPCVMMDSMADHPNAYVTSAVINRVGGIRNG